MRKKRLYRVAMSIPLKPTWIGRFSGQYQNTILRPGAEQGKNPFEGTANDVPITTMSRGIEIDLREMLDEPSENIPKPIGAKYNTEM